MDDWTIANVRDWRSLAEDPAERDITEALAWFLLDIGVREISTATFSKVMIRIRRVEGVNGFKLRLADGKGGFPLVEIPQDAVYRRIGMTARVKPLSDKDFNALIKREEAAKARHLARTATA